MGLLDDVLGGLASLGRAQGSGGFGSILGGGGTSTLVAALLGLMAAKAATGGLGGMPGENRQPDDYNHEQAQSGGLDGMPGGSSGGLGSLLGAGGIAGGLGHLVNQFQQSGHGEVANSWVGTRQSQPIQSGQVAQTLGPDIIEKLVQRTGMSEQEVVSQLSTALPHVVNQLTPQGRLPSHEEAQQWV